MSDGQDYFQQQAESQVRVARPIRVVLGLLVLLAAIGFVFLGAVLLPHQLQLPNPPNTIGTLLFGAFLVAALTLSGETRPWQFAAGKAFPDC